MVFYQDRHYLCFVTIHALNHCMGRLVKNTPFGVRDRQWCYYQLPGLLNRIRATGNVAWLQTFDPR